MTRIKPLAPEQLYWRCDPQTLPFTTTTEIEAPEEALGQARALEALRFGIGMDRSGYNLFALGPTGLGKHAVVRQYIERAAQDQPGAVDWCYVNNFTEPQKPRALELPAGYARRLRDDMDTLVQELRAAIPAAFESEDYRSRKESIEGEVKAAHEQAMEHIQQRARERGIALIRTPAGLGFAPVRDDEVMSPDAFRSLPEDERARIEEDIESLQAELQRQMHQLPSLVKESRRKLEQLNREITSFAAGHPIDELRQAYAGLDNVQRYLDAVRDDVIDSAEEFLRAEEGASGGSGGGSPFAARVAQQPSFERYKVNVLVDRTNATGAPVVYEDNPTYQRLVGNIEHTAQMGALVTDFTLIKSGALHRANGGYLVLEARKLLQHFYAYEALKQALRAGHIRIEPLGHALSLVSTRSLEPEPIPLDVKIVLLGERLLYYLLWYYDPEFGELFKVAADFDDRVERNEDSATRYARLLAGLAHENKLKPLDRTGVARALEHGARLAGDAERLSVHLESVADVLREADYWSAQAGKDAIDAADIQRAIDAQKRRANRMQERLEEEIERGTILIDTSGSTPGQVNGLAVVQLANYAFGRPNRITARVRMGKGEVVDIEREVALGGPIHSKGVLILSGFLGERFGVDQPLSLSASLVFEQSYGGVEGDSASSAELYALLSALAEVPLTQAMAVTGSVNQHGRVQAIGGVSEKIEGFFDVCKARGLTGEQGVLIPAANVKHLMLRADVIEAVERGEFHIYPIETIDQGIECLSGMAAGERDVEGRYPENSINGRVAARLRTFAENLRAYAARERPGEQPR